MNYLIKIIILFLVNVNVLLASEISNERILFKIENNAYTSIDLEVRKNYLKLLNEEIAYEGKFLLKDYISVLFFSNFYYNSKYNFNPLNINENFWAKYLNLDIS